MSPIAVPAAAQSLSDGEAALRLACEGAGLGLWEWDVVTDAMAYSPVARTICGFDPDGAVTFEMVRQATHPDDLPFTHAQARRALDPAVRGSDPFEYRVVRPDGEVRWVLAYGHAVFDGEGRDARALRYVGTIQDITERRQTTEALQASERRLRLALDAGRLAVWEYDAASGAITASVELNRLLGFPDDYEPSRDERAARYLPGEEDRVRAVGRAALDAGRTDFDVEYGFRRLDGEERWALLRAQLQIDAAGVPTGAIGVLLDVTERKQAELDLADSEAKLRASETELRQVNLTLEQRVAERTAERDLMWRLSQDLLLVIGPDGVVRAVNPAAQALGYESEDIAGEHFGKFVHTNDLSAAVAALAEATEGRLPDLELRLLAADGSPRTFLWSGSMAEGAIYAVGRDLTEERGRQEALQLAQEALRQSHKMEAMGQLTGGVAHDFNNLLMPIMGSLDVLRRRASADAREQRLVDGAMEAAERAKTLVQRLLAFARRQPLRSEAVDLGRLAAGMADLIASTCGPRTSVEIHIPADLPPAQADANQLEMALLNLAVNARDAMPDGGRLIISAELQFSAQAGRPELAPGGYVRLGVADTGGGMDAATLARAVEPFFSTKGVGRGTGLGLSMVHGLAAQLGGALAIDSKVGLGTRVDLWLPLAQSAAASATAATNLPEGQTKAGAALLVDDEGLVREATTQMLEDLGYAVTQAASAEEALAILEKLPTLDLLVTDHLMPGMTGAELARLVRETRPGAQVLIISGYAETEAIAPDLPRLAKPFVQQDLAATIAHLAG